jgi:hypothetical protein
VNREAYLVNMPQPVLQRETNDASRTTAEEGGLFEHPAGAFSSCSARLSSSQADVQGIEVVLCRNDFSAAC